MPEIIAGPLLTAGLNATFIDTWFNKYEASTARLSKCMQLAVPSNKRRELYAYLETAPYPERWDMGTDIPMEAMEARGFNVLNHDWGKRIVWHYNDRRDDQVGTLYLMAQQLGEHFATLDERRFFQVIQGTVDPLLLPSIPLAPDGLAIYAAGRFGVAAGNILAGAGVATEEAIYNDFIDGVSQQGTFLDPKGQPIFSDAGKNYTVVFAMKNLKVFQKAFKREYVVQTTGGTSAAPSNVIGDAGYNVELWPTSRITTDKWFLFANDVPQKAVFTQLREGIMQQFGTLENSDLARTTKREYTQWVQSSGVGVRVPYATIKVDN